jgi:hypothetical protein
LRKREAAIRQRHDPAATPDKGTASLRVIPPAGAALRAVRAGSSRAVAALVGFLCVAASGCASTPVAPALVLRAFLGQETYRIGEPLTATVSLLNQGAESVSVARFDQDVLTFCNVKKGLGVPIRREPVHSRSVKPVSLDVEPGRSIARRFLFTRLTVEEGEYGLQASLKGAVSASGVVGPSVRAEPVFYSVVPPVALDRDPNNGLILKAQATTLAKGVAPGKVAASRTVLMPLGESGLYAWVVVMRVVLPEGAEQECVVQVNAYTGRAERLDLEEGSKVVSDDLAGLAAPPAMPPTLENAATAQGAQEEAGRPAEGASGEGDQ